MLFHNPVVLARRFATLDLLSEGRTICGFKPIQNHIFRFIWEGLVHIRTIKKELQSWPYVTAEPYRFGGLEFRLNKREMGHIHGDRVADLPLPRDKRDKSVNSGRVSVHHFLAQSGCVS
jgi:hypothetical protein